MFPQNFISSKNALKNDLSNAVVILSPDFTYLAIKNDGRGVPMNDVISAINKTVWGAPMLFLLLGCGIYLTIRLRCFQIFKARAWMGETIGSLLKRERSTKKGISPYQAVSAALAATVGSGNVVGVATAIAAGGAGAVFWMWVSAFFGMATKYAEIFLAVKFRRKNEKGFYGGPMYYIESGLGKGYKWLAVAFSFFGALACIGMGAMNQANSIATIISKNTGAPNIFIGFLLAIITGFAISGGIQKISRITEYLVPLMASLYVGMGLVVMLLDPKASALALSGIFKAAFKPSALYGGAAGTMMKHALRFGLARGVFSNEAGLGSSPIVHAAADAKSAEKQGFWGVFEVFLDTMLICTVTAVVVLCGAGEMGQLSGAQLVSAAFSRRLGWLGGTVVEISTILFALSTMLGWSYYGESCTFYLSKGHEISKRIYRCLFVLAVVFGTVLRAESVWELSDMFNGMMMIPNLIAILLLSDTVIKNRDKENLR